jgi:hypothetical protein
VCCTTGVKALARQCAVYDAPCTITPTPLPTTAKPTTAAPTTPKPTTAPLYTSDPACARGTLNAVSTSRVLNARAVAARACGERTR